MTALRRVAFVVLSAAALTGFGGCQSMPRFSEMSLPSFGEVLHELKPHRLHRWNRQEPPSRSMQWSVDDPIPALDDGPQAVE